MPISAGRPLAEKLLPVGSRRRAGRLAAGLMMLGMLTACALGPPLNGETSTTNMPGGGITLPLGLAPTDDSQTPSVGTGTRFRADADMQAVLDQLAVLGGQPTETLTPQQARLQPTAADAVKALLIRRGRSTTPTDLVPGVTSRDRLVAGAAGPLPARVYTPDGPGPFPVVLYFHGGGWVLADKEAYDAGARGLARQANAVVLSVDYRRAPEGRFPAAWNDALAAYRWAANHPRALNGRPRQLALAGEGAGGNLAVATAVAARDARLPKPAAVIAIYPIVQISDRETASYVDSANAKPLNKPMIGWFIDKLLARPAQQSDRRLDLLHARLAGLPPVTIINAQIDPLREDGAMLDSALEASGVPVARKVYPGTTHEFFGMAAVVHDAKAAQEFAGERLKQAFEQTAAKH